MSPDTKFRSLSTSAGTREDTRIARVRSRLGDPHAAVADLVTDVCREDQDRGKGVSAEVDLSYSQVRKMSNDGSIPNLKQILEFIKLAGPAHPFRQALIDELETMFDPTAEEIAAKLQERVERGVDYADAIEEVLGITRMGGRWVRTRP